MTISNTFRAIVIGAGVAAILGSAFSPARAQEANIDFGVPASAVQAVDGEKPDLATHPWLVESINLPANHPALQRDRMIWANSFLWTAITDAIEADAIPVERWLTAAPTAKDLAGKYILVEMWATWCPPCRRSLPYLNFIAEKYKDNLAVVSICETDEEAIRNMPGDRIDLEKVNYFVAYDTGRRLANKLGVYGIPHVVLLEPMLGGVVWEGMPTAPRYELDDKTLERFFAVGAKLKEAGRLPQESPVKFAVSEPNDEFFPISGGSRGANGVAGAF